jgi:hypothetical protein
MAPTDYSVLAGAIFTIVAVLQLTRAILGTEVKVGNASIPVWASWIAFLVAGVLAWMGFTAAHG